MIISTFSLIYALKALVAGSIFFVWVVRYNNIIKEFDAYGLPSWLRDLVGILKLSFTLMLFSSDSTLVIFGASAILFLMLAAIATHLRVHNPIFKMVPSVTLMTICSFIAILTFQNF